MDIIESIERAQLRDDIPSFRAGDTVKVHYKVVEAGRERIQVFQGAVIKKQNGGIRLWRMKQKFPLQLHITSAI